MFIFLNYIERPKKAKKNWADTSPERIYKWQIITWKDAQCLCSLGKIHIKSTIRYYSSPRAMAKIKMLAISSAREDMEQLELLYIAGRNAKQFSHSGKQFDSFLQWVHG